MNDKNKKNELLEPLIVALNLEKEGKQLFLKAAAETDSKLARQTFEFLAKEEDHHIANIEEFYKSLESTIDADIMEVEDSNADEKLELFNKKLESLVDGFSPTKTDVDAYKLALQFENGAEEYYQELYDKATNPKVKKFYKWLIIEETMHSRLINSCLKFVEDPAEWFKSRK